MNEKYAPKVGEVCLYLDNTKLTETKILAIHPNGKYAWHEAIHWFEDGRNYSTDSLACFRPLKTPAEIEREEAIEKMAITCGKGKSSVFTVTSICERAYDAGYHNGPKVDKPINLYDLENFIFNNNLRGHGGEFIARTILENFDIFKKVQS